jgi:parallel beta-helix repeat protein
MARSLREGYGIEAPMHDPPSPLGRCSLLLLLLLLLLAWACLPAGPTGAGEDPPARRLEGDDLSLTASTRISRGVYRIADANGNGVLRITGDDVRVDLTGVTLIGAPDDADPDRFQGVGIEIQGARNVTIHGGRIRGYRVAVRARNAPGLVIEGLDASGGFRQRLRSTPEREAAEDWLWPHENDKDEWETRYGAGFSLTACDEARISNCRVQDGQNGLLLTRCSRARIYDNEFAFNSGWGVALYRSSRCEVSHNRCDWCVRGFSEGIYERGQDSAGILVFEQCRGNVFVANSATHCGDGFFLYAGHETTQRTGQGGSNDNLVFENDFSHAVANGIEATFSTGNVFVRNDCSDADHGIWAGYSSGSLFVGNKIENCRSAGVSIEHGQENRLQYNRIVGARDGIHLWWDPDEAFVHGVFGKARSTRSERNVIQGNDILGSQTALRLVDDQQSEIRWNVLAARETLLFLGPKSVPASVEHNHFRGPRVESRAAPTAVVNASGLPWTLPAENSRRGPLQGGGPLDPTSLPEEIGFLRPKARGPETPQVAGSRRTALPAAMPRGRGEIRIGPWGPLDPRLPHAWPTEIAGTGGEARVQLSGRGRFRVTGSEGRVTVEPREGDLPATLRIRPAAATTGTPVPALVPFRVDLALGALPETIRGTLLDALWTVRFFEWRTDPRTEPSAFQALLAGPPRAQEETRALAYLWGGGGPAGVRGDRFATLATTSVSLPAGRYRLRTVSDDGVRVYVNGVRVTDNWTHHAPTEDIAEVSLEAGTHEIRIEHFELDGLAQLTFDLVQIP